MREDQLRTAATDALTALERQATDAIEAAYAEVLVRAGAPARSNSPVRRRRWFAATAAVGMLVAGGLTVAVVAHDGGGRVQTSPSASIPETVEPTAATSPSPATTSPATTATSTTVAEGQVPMPLGLRPYIDPASCPAVAAREGPTFERIDWDPFTMGEDRIATYQFIGDPDLGAGGPFALVAVLTSPFFDLTRRSAPPTEINGWTVAVSATDQPGSASALVNLPDGRQAYLRAREFSSEMVHHTIAALTVRTPDAAIPGFDYNDALGPPGMQLIHEQIPAPLSGVSNRFQCSQGIEPAQEGGTNYRWYTIWSVEGDRLLQYLSVLDRPYPVETGVMGESVIVIDGPDLPGRPTVSEVVEAPLEVWDELLDNPLWERPGDEATTG